MFTYTFNVLLNIYMIKIHKGIVGLEGDNIVIFNHLKKVNIHYFRLRLFKFVFSSINQDINLSSRHIHLKSS